MTPDMFAPQPRARKTDPQTSHDAAAAMAGVKCNTHYARILVALWRPMIPPEIAAETGLSIVQIDRRRRELMDRGTVVLTGIERGGYQEWARA